MRAIHGIGRLSGLLFLLVQTSALVAQSASAPLLLRPGDGIRLTVRDEPTLSGDFAVSEPGVVLLPEVGIISVENRGFEEVAREVRGRYERLLVGTEMIVVPLLRVAVLGEVRLPGIFPVDPSHTLADVLALAGGFTPEANLKAITLIRGGQQLPVELSPDQPTATQWFRSGDQILVGRHGWFKENLGVIYGASASVIAAVVTSLLIR